MSGPWQGTENDARLRGIADRDTQTAWWVGIADADHNDMVVTPLFSPIADRLGLKGPISSDVVVPMLDRYLNGFFDRVMLGVDPNLLDRPAQPGSDLELIP